MSEIINYLDGYLNELNNYMERLNSNRLSRKDRRIFLEMSNEYYDMFKEASGENTINTFPVEVLDAMAAFSDNMISQEENSQELANQLHETIVTTANEHMEMVERSELQFHIFQNDAEILRLQEEKLQMMQNLVNLEMKRDGQISPETAAILDVQHSRIVNGQVQEIGAWEQEDIPKPPVQTTDLQVEHVKEKSVLNKEDSEINKNTAGVELQLPYIKRDNFMKVKEDLKRMGAKFDPKGKIWYVEQGAGQDAVDRINEYLAQNDDGIYLKLPSVDAQKFKQMIGEIKQNGARYNPIKKKWYITETMDRNKFSAYLPKSEMLSEKGKDSIHQKLNQYKENTAKASSTGRMIENHKKDVHERI